MQENTVEKALQNFGLTEKETQIYICLAKHGLQKGVEIAKKTKTAKAVVYRILKILQRKGFVESTLESPVRYKTIPFEIVLDLEIKAKHEEAHQIETAKKDLLNDWTKISKGEPESPIEKFTVIEGTQKIYNKMYQMIKQTKKQLSFIATVPGIIQSERYGIISEIINHPLKSKAKFRFLTDITNADINSIRFIKQKLRTIVDLRGRNPELGLKPFPRMVLRDKEEILFVINSKENQSGIKTEDTCLCTNCNSIIQAFGSVFENLWENSIDIEEKIGERETGKNPQIIILKDPVSAKNIYLETLGAAKDEILIVTSSRGLVQLHHEKVLLKKLGDRGVRIKVLSPITGKNLESAQQLLGFCEVKHISAGYQGTIIVDGEHLFQFKFPSLEETNDYETAIYKNTLYATDLRYVKNSRRMFLEIWKTAQILIGKPLNLIVDPLINPRKTSDKRKRDFHADLEGIIKFDEKGIKRLKDKNSIDELTEKDFLRIILQSQITSSRRNAKGIIRQYGTSGRAIIHPPRSFNLPEMVFIMFRFDKHSCFGAEDSLIIGVSGETHKGSKFLPAAFVGDNPEALNFVKNGMFKGLIPENNFSLFDKDELQMRVHGNNLFCSWTKPINLMDKFELPPSAILLQAYGDIRTRAFSVRYPSGYQMDQAGNYLESFVTFYHPTSRYSGPGTDSIFDRDIFMEIHKIE
ncbi:hypothetical protein E2P63_04495 [Candidatus Bathyarchaeota archaeon]|nr:hypothetical protein E2P63_04495 [Candidatus Bathyarchaeota archaeon]